MQSTSPRKKAPTARSEWDDAMPFLVWAHRASYQEDMFPWKCCGAFRFLDDALKYVSAIQDDGMACVMVSPADVKAYCGTDRRAVMK